MRNWLRFVTSGIAALAAFAVLTEAQITVPFPAFTAGTTIQPDEVNQNFAKFGDALNRTGGTMTGTLTTRDLLPEANGTRDLGATGTRFRHAYLTGTVFTVGASLTGASGEVITTSVAPGYSLAESDATSTNKNWMLVVDSGVLYHRLYNDAFSTYNDWMTVTRSGTTPGTTTLATALTVTGAVTHSGAVTHGGALFETSIISPTTITADQNDYAPTGFATARVLRLTHNNTGATRSITGLAGGASGRTVLLCNVNTGASENFLLSNESASSTAANRITATTVGEIQIGQCRTLFYDGTSSRWRVAS